MSVQQRLWRSMLMGIIAFGGSFAGLVQSLLRELTGRGQGDCCSSIPVPEAIDPECL